LTGVKNVNQGTEGEEREEGGGEKEKMEGEKVSRRGGRGEKWICGPRAL